MKLTRSSISAGIVLHLMHDYEERRAVSRNHLLGSVALHTYSGTYHVEDGHI